jgi:hypothetical protein
MRWPQSNAAKSWQNALRQRRRKRWPTRPTSNVEWPRRRKRWRTRPTSNAGPLRGTKRWPTRLTSNIAMRQRQQVLLLAWGRHHKYLRRRHPLPTAMLRGNLRRMPHPSLLALTPSWPKSKPWMAVLATGLRSVTSSLLRRTTKPQLQQCSHQHPRRPCRHPPTALSLIWMQSSLTWGGALKQRPLLWHRRLYHRLPSMANSGRHANAPNLDVVLADAMAHGLPIQRSTFFAGGNIGPALTTNLLCIDGLKR